MQQECERNKPADRPCHVLCCSFTRRVRLDAQGHTSYVLALDWSVDGHYLQSNGGDYEILFCPPPSLSTTPHSPRACSSCLTRSSQLERKEPSGTSPLRCRSPRRCCCWAFVVVGGLFEGDTELRTQITASGSLKDVNWATWTCKIGWPVQGQLPPPLFASPPAFHLVALPKNTKEDFSHPVISSRRNPDGIWHVVGSQSRHQMAQCSPL